MKKILLQLSAIAILFLISCGKDDGGDGGVSLENQAEFQDVTYDLSAGLISDYGQLSEVNYYNYDFEVTDGDITVEESEGEFYSLYSSDTEIFVYMELFNEGSSFSTGTFNFADEDDVEGVDESELPEKFFVSAYVVVADGESIFEGEEFDAIGGSVTVSGSGTNFNITFDLTVEGGVKLTGSYSGDFEFIDETAD